MSPRTKSILLVLIILFILPFSVSANTSVARVDLENNRLRFDLHLYFWPAGLDGEVSAGTHRADTNIRFRDIIDDLKMGANGAWKISKGQWFLFNDLLYLDLAHKTSQNIASIPGASVDVTLTTRVLTDLLVVVRQWRGPVEWNIFLGARYFYGKVRLDAIERLGPFHREALLIKSKEWITPTIGGGLCMPFNNRLALHLTGDVGVLEGSFNWEAIPVLSWKFNDTVSAEAGISFIGRAA